MLGPDRPHYQTVRPALGRIGRMRRGSMAKSFDLTRRHVLAAAGAAALSGRSAFAQGGAGRPPNIVYILADDMGYADLSCYGRREYKTSNIDSIGAGGVRFLQAYANS